MSFNRELQRARPGVLLTVALSLALLGAACVPKPSGAPPAAPTPGPIGEIVSRHNSARASAGLAQLAVDGGMNANAQFHAERLARSGGGSCNLWHSSELGSWYAGHSSAENVACIGPCPGDGAQQLMSLWLNSPDHRANIYDPAFRYIGVGVACNGRAMYAAVHFRN